MLGKNWKITRIALPILLLLVIIATVLFSRDNTEKISTPTKGFFAPEFTLNSLDGNPYQLKDFRGKIVVINLWASWCPPCVAEMEAFQNTYAEYEEQGLVILGVNMSYNDNLSDVVNFVNENQIEFLILLDEEGEVSQNYKMLALPTTFFVDSEGVIEDVIVGGPVSESLLKSKIETMLAEK